MSENKKPNSKSEKEKVITHLESGEPVADFFGVGMKVSLAKEFDHAPTGVGLVKFANGRVLAMNRRAMVLLDPPDQDERFSKTDNTVGATVNERFPEGIPELTIGEVWAESGVLVERVTFRPKYAYTIRRGAIDASMPTPGENLFNTAEDILRSFETTHLYGGTAA